MSTTTINKILILKKYNEAKELRLNCQIRDVLNNIVDYIEAEEEIKTGKKNLTVEQLVRIKTNKRTAEVRNKYRKMFKNWKIYIC